MKKLATLIFLFISLNSFASHMIGGEITWKQSGGTYVFTLKVYVECAPGTSAFTTSAQSIDVTGHPSIINIIANLVSTTEMSPINCGFSCAGNNTNGSTFEEYVFRSNPVNLGNFTPPASGWIFTWNLCCRNDIQNISGSSGFGMTLRSIMYVYNNSTLNKLHNSSPEFMVKSPKLFCAGSNVVISQSTVESDGDSLSYAFDKCADGNAPNLSLLNYSTPYTVSNPLPGIVTLDAVNGDLNWQTSTSVVGNFGVCVRVDEYRCGVKIASVFREDQYATSVTCSPINGGNTNAAPLVQINLIPSNSYIDTVDIGDTVSLNISIWDFDLSSGTLAPQNVQLLTYGEFGTNDTSSIGCNEPPCATLNIPGETFYPAAQSYQFNWVPDCNNFTDDGFASDCNNGIKRMQFLLRAQDDYCPAAGYNDIYITLFVRVPNVQQLNDTVFCLNSTGTYQWFLDSVPISGATNSWHIPVASGFYNVINITANGCIYNSVSIYVNANCSYTPTVTGNVYLCPQQGTVLSTQNFASYQWYERDLTGFIHPIIGATSQTLNVLPGSAGRYYAVEVSDSFCMEKSVEVQIKNLPAMTIQLSPNLSPLGFNYQYYLCEGDTAQLNINPVFNTNVVWTNNGDTISGANSNVLIITDSGHYSVSGASADCAQNILTSQYSITVILDPCISSIRYDERYTSMSLRPNPAKTNFTLEFNAATEELAELVIYSTSGLLVYRDFKNIVSGTNIISFGSMSLDQGTYIVSLKSDSGLARCKLVIN